MALSIPYLGRGSVPRLPALCDSKFGEQELGLREGAVRASAGHTLVYWTPQSWTREGEKLEGGAQPQPSPSLP